MIYLSVDLDFWTKKRFSTKLFDQIIQLNVPTIIVESHEQLIPHINKCKFDTLFNVDYHSDLASQTDRHLVVNEGTWGNFVKNSHKKTFVWVPPAKYCVSTNVGYCHGSQQPNPFEDKRPKISGWMDTQIKINIIPPLKDISGVGIALSIFWTPDNVMKKFIGWYKKIKPSFDLHKDAKDVIYKQHSWDRGIQGVIN